MDSPPVNVARFDDLGGRTLYAIMQLRTSVFVVEQECVFCDPDGRDIEPDTLHLWIGEADQIRAYARLLRDADGATRIGRFVTHPDHRGQGLAARLLDEALRLGAPPYHLWAQAHLAEWYATFGFEVSGPGEVEDGIPHVPMRRLHPA